MSANNDKIARLAYQIWDQEGRPEGRDMEHWLRAEADIAAPKTKAKTKPKAVMPVAAEKLAKPKAAVSGKPKAVKPTKSAKA